MSLTSLVHGRREAVVDRFCDSSEIPRVDLDRLTQKRSDTSEFGDEERTLRLGLTDDVLHTVDTSRARKHSRSAVEGSRRHVPGRVHAVPARSYESDVCDSEEREVFLERAKNV